MKHTIFDTRSLGCAIKWPHHLHMAAPRGPVVFPLADEGLDRTGAIPQVPADPHRLRAFAVVSPPVEGGFGHSEDLGDLVGSEESVNPVGEGHVSSPCRGRGGAR